MCACVRASENVLCACERVLYASVSVCGGGGGGGGG